MQIKLSLCYLCMHLCTWMPINRCWYRARASVTCAARASSLPQFVPQDKAKEIRSPQAWDMLMSYQQCTVDVAGLPSLRTSFVGPRLHSQTPDDSSSKGQPILLLHGFDSNALEFRNIYPYLSQNTDTFAVDLLGCASVHTILIHTNVLRT